MTKKQQYTDVTDDSESLDQEKEAVKGVKEQFSGVPEEKRKKRAQSSESKSIKDSKLSFPWRLHQMLNDAERDGFEGIVSWQAGGKSFKVHKNADFVNRVMPRYFNQTKFKSFGRQLHIYGFTWVSKGTDRGAYFHPEFIRSDMSLCLNIFRKKFKGTPSQSAKILEDDDETGTEPHYPASLKGPPPQSSRSRPQFSEPQHRASLKSPPPQSNRSSPQTTTEVQYRASLKGSPPQSSLSGPQHGSEATVTRAHNTSSSTHFVGSRRVQHLQPTDPIVVTQQAPQIPGLDDANVGSYFDFFQIENDAIEPSPSTLRNANTSDFLQIQQPVARLPEEGVLQSGGSSIEQQIAQGMTNAYSGLGSDSLRQVQAPDIPVNSMDLEPRSIEAIVANPQPTLQNTLETLFQQTKRHNHDGNDDGTGW